MGAQLSNPSIDRLPNNLWLPGGGIESPVFRRRTSKGTSDRSPLGSNSPVDDEYDPEYSKRSSLEIASDAVLALNDSAAPARRFSSPPAMQARRRAKQQLRVSSASQAEDDSDFRENMKMELKRRVSFQQRMRYDLVLDRTAGHGGRGRLTLITTSHFDRPGFSESPSVNKKNHLLACPTEINLQPVTERVDAYNHGVGRERMWVSADGTALEGYIEVQLSLKDPIHVVRQAPQQNQGGMLDGVDHRRASLQLVRLDSGSKTLLVSSDTTTDGLIEQLVEAYNVVESPRMFALFECDLEMHGQNRRLDGEERPLLLTLIWGPNSSRCLLLQEAHPGGTAAGRSHDWREVRGDRELAERQESLKQARRKSRTGRTINWQAFSVPELNNFLSILDFEEERQVKKLEEKYLKYRHALLDLIVQKAPKR